MSACKEIGDGLRVFCFSPHERHARCGWQAEHFPAGKRAVSEAVVIVSQQRLKHRVIRKFGLHHDFTGQRVTTRATSDLGEQRKQIFLRTKVS